MSTLAEIIAVFDRIEAEINDHLPGEVKSDAWREHNRLARIHCARLLAVAKAALLVRREASVDTTHVESRCPCVRCQRMRAFDAAAGEGPKP